MVCSETDRRGSDGEQILGGKNAGEGTPWEVGDGGGLGRQGLAVDTGGLPASMEEEGPHKVQAGVCTHGVTAADTGDHISLTQPLSLVPGPHPSEQSPSADGAPPSSEPPPSHLEAEADCAHFPRWSAVLRPH